MGHGLCSSNIYGMCKCYGKCTMCKCYGKCSPLSWESSGICLWSCTPESLQCVSKGAAEPLKSQRNTTVDEGQMGPVTQSGPEVTGSVYRTHSWLLCSPQSSFYLPMIFHFISLTCFEWTHSHTQQIWNCTAFKQFLNLSVFLEQICISETNTFPFGFWISKIFLLIMKIYILYV